METRINKLLFRQVKRYFGGTENIPEAIQGFIRIIDDTYNSFDDDNRLLQNSLELSSVEMRAAYERHRIDAEIQKNTLSKIRKAILRVNRGKSEMIHDEVHASDSNYLIDLLLRHIEESRNNENKLRKLSQAVEQSPASVVITDLNGKIEYVNQKFTQTTGFSHDEVIGKLSRVFNPERLTDKVFSDLRSTISQGKEWRGEFRNTRKNGELFWTSAHLSPILNESGEVTHFLTIEEDITSKKILEENLHKQTRLRNLLMEIASGFINIPFNRVDESVNNSLEKMGSFVNADRSYIFYYDWDRQTASNVFEWCAEGIDQQIGNLQHIPVEPFLDWVNAHRKGEQLYIADSSALPEGILKEMVLSQDVKSILTVPMMNEEQCIGFIGFDYVRQYFQYHDTELQLLKLFSQSLANLSIRKTMTQELIKAKENAEESDRLKTHFMNNISHEIRTPLNGILGFGDLMLDSQLSQEDKKHYHGILQRNSSRLQQTVTDIMDIAELKAGSLKKNLRKMNIREVMTKSIDQIKSTCAVKNVLVSLKIPAELQETILVTDEEFFIKILMHLLTNAEKFTAMGRITAGFTMKEQWVEFFVQDTGKGISTDKMEAVFEPFMQEDVSSTRGYEGSGLGLSIARGLTELLGGRLWVESTQGVGSTFFFTLPRVEVNAISPSALTRNFEKNDPENPVVLVVEDDESSAELLQVMLQREGYLTLHAWNGTEAIDLCRKFPEIVLVFMDIKMPVMNGLEATAELKKMRPGLPVIALTAHAQPGDRYRMLDAGCDFYISKPIQTNEFPEILKRYI